MNIGKYFIEYRDDDGVTHWSEGDFEYIRFLMKRFDWVRYEPVQTWTLRAAQPVIKQRMVLNQVTKEIEDLTPRLVEQFG